MHMLTENLWHAVQGACSRGKNFLHDEASAPPENSARRYRAMSRNMMRDSAELEAESDTGSDAALNDLIAELIAERH